MPRMVALVVALVGSSAWGADAVRLMESAPVGAEYRVITEFTFTGELTLPLEKGKPPERVKMSGRSAIDYAERILKVDPKEADHKSLRVYEKFDFRKTTGDRTDQGILRDPVRRLVMMKRGHAKVPFSPDGPLKWGEIEMLRTDFVVPALAGLLSDKDVNEGDTWTASETAVRELTDIDKVDSGKLECKLEKVETVGPRRVAHVSFSGTLSGVNEDGPMRQKLSGKLIVDVAAKRISYLKIDGTQDLLDEKGMQAGQIRGTFQMTRSGVTGHPALAEESIAKLELSPTEENTLLLVDGDPKGIKFIHPRRWHVGRATGRQITMDETGGAGLLMTIELPRNLPTTNDYLREALKELQTRGGKLVNRTSAKSLADGVDVFTFDVEAGKEQFTMAYFVIRQPFGGATIAARIPEAEKAARMKEVEAIVRSFTVTQRPDGK
ncbi:hypothetical protein [Zavarzinella formosa]|uniref:hypothetical protein n=1 Tax=Zavarzinella formosa TaxID=360055 RepID=UPI0002F48A84|nr:hypothetical protein [Zavarzinella formosa]